MTERRLADRAAAERFADIPARTIRERLTPVACDRRSRRVLYDLAEVAHLAASSVRRPRRKRDAA